MARALKSVLESMDFRVVALGRDGAEGVQLYQSHRPDVTLLDVTMPNMDGLECLRTIRQLDPDARVVMLSAVHDEEIVSRCIAAGAAAFLQKPIRKDDEGDLTRLRSTLEDAAQAVG